MKAPRLLPALLIAPLLASAAACAQSEPTISAEDLRADMTDWQDWFFATHPNPAFSMDVDAVVAELATISASLNGDYTRREAWLALSLINPDFNDGHMAISMPMADYEAYLETGGANFTLPVRIEGGRVFIADTVIETSPFEAGAEILSINGAPVTPMVVASLERTHGDGDGLRTYLIEQRFSRYLWALTGGAASWRVETSRAVRDIDPARDIATTETDQWILDFADDAAILTLNTFSPEYEEAFAAFIEPAFAEIAEAGSEVLVIDLSANGGGAHQLSDLLLSYLTDTRYTPLSAVTARITPGNQALIPGSELGQVVSTPFTQWVEPAAEQENRFKGTFGFLIGTGTYSQAIVTAATVQDFDIAPVAGVATGGRANSTGQVQVHTLSRSGLDVAAPIYIFTRASGDTSGDPVIPDLPLEGSRENQLEAFIAYLRAAP